MQSYIRINGYMLHASPTIFRHLAAAGDLTRCRMLRLLGSRELTVGEICAVLQLPQSSISRHLKTLLDDGWVASRRDGTSRYYSLSPELAQTARDLWALVSAQLDDTPTSRQDDARVEEVLAERRSRSRAFFSSAAGEWERLRAEMFGRTFHLRSLVGLVPPDWEVADLGCGGGEVSAILAPWAARVVAVDGSEEMLTLARERLGGFPNVECRRGDLEQLPLDSASLDAAVISLVLPYVPDPAAVLRESLRVLRPGGRLLLIDLLPHERVELQQELGHVWLGFSEQQVSRLLEQAGYAGFRFRAIPPEPEARGPALFAVSAHRPTTGCPRGAGSPHRKDTSL